MSILITGATGFLGGALTAELLASPDWPQVLLLVRAENPAHALARVIQRLKRFAIADEHLARVRAEQIVCVDLATPVPLPDDERLRSIRKVVHCAASTSFGANTEVFSTNVDGTLRLARHLQRIASLDRFLYVSTAMICGTRPDTIVHEDDYPHEAVEHFVSYTRSKANAEQQLRTLPGLPLVVVRPSIIVGHTRLGCQPSGSIFWTFRIADALRMVTSAADGRIDVVPVDYAAQVLLLLLSRKTLAHSTYHLSAGTEASCSWTDVSRAFGRARGAPDAELQSFRTAHVRDIDARRQEFASLFGRCSQRLMMRAIKLYGAFAGLNCVFSNDRLRTEGAGLPPRFSDYLDVCLRSCADTAIAEQMLIDL